MRRVLLQVMVHVASMKPTRPSLVNHPVNSVAKEARNKQAEEQNDDEQHLNRKYQTTIVSSARTRPQ